MRKLASNHHSVADWDFTPGMYKGLNNALYVSPPSCLDLTYQEGTPTFGSVLCRIPETLCIPQGEIRTWFRTTHRERGWWITFRNQKPLGNADYENSYIWSLAGDWATLARIVNGDSTWIKHFPIYYVRDIWYHWRTIYWNGFTPQGEPALVCELYLEVDGEWVKQVETLYDPINQWKESEINRSGIGGRVNGIWHFYFDDTEIWGEV